MNLANIIDLETGGITPGSAIFSIGAVIIDLDTSDEIGHFYEVIAQDSDNGKLSLDTMLWWAKQDEPARRAVFNHGEEACSMVRALEKLREFHYENGAQTVWGNGATFDISMLEYFFVRHGITIPWNFWEVRDVRTLQDLVGSKVRDNTPFVGIKHHALHDAYHEAQYTARMWQIARKALENAND